MYLRNKNYKRIIIESSPFLRTLETAAIIANELKIPEIKVNYKAFEWMEPNSFKDASIVNKLALTKCDFDFVTLRI